MESVHVIETYFESLSMSVVYTMGCLYGLLFCATLIVYFLVPKLSPNKDHGELQLRTKSWWYMLTFVVLCILGPRMARVILLGLLCFLALREFYTIIPLRDKDRILMLWGFMAIPVHFYFVYTGWYGMFVIFIPVYIFLFFPLRMVLIGETKGFLNAVATLHWGIMLNVFCLSHLAMLLLLQQPVSAEYLRQANQVGGAQMAAGAGLGLFLLILTELNDVAQFCWGKLLGRHKITPKVSPKKTVEGFVGGLVTTTVLSVCLHGVLTPLSLRHAVIAGILISGFGFVGDIVVSAVKRDLGIKDSGTLIPGHGGILDRLDSLTYTAPVFFHFVYYFYY